jgi:hypothetical protein
MRIYSCKDKVFSEKRYLELGEIIVKYHLLQFENKDLHRKLVFISGHC